jgi:hypothetical protein
VGNQPFEREDSTMTALRFGLASLLACLLTGALSGCGSSDSERSRGTFGGAAGDGAAAGMGGVAGAAASSGAGGAGGFGYSGQGGFTFLADASTGGAGNGTGGAAGGAAASGNGGSGAADDEIVPDAAAGSGAWSSWSGMDGSSCVGVGCGNDGATAPDAAECAGEAREGKAITLDVIILFDNSSSMSCDVSDPACTNETGVNTRIAAVSQAINSFVSAPETADVRVGLDPFPPADPLASQCDHDYSVLDIPIAPAKDNKTTFATVLGGLTPHLNTPTEQALTGAYSAAKTYMAANPGRSVAVVLVTDGMPFACNNDKTGAVSASIAKAAYEGSPSIKTYVVGMGNVATLDAIALAGTGGTTHYIEANADATAKILALLKSVTSTITCDYTIPTGGSVLDYGAVNVKTKVDDAPFAALYKVDSAAACDARGGWFYDVNPPATPTKISLCPQSCDPLKAAQSSSMQVVIGCATMTIQ